MPTEQHLRVTPVISGSSAELHVEVQSQPGIWTAALRRPLSITESCQLPESDPKTTVETSAGKGWETLAIQRATPTAALNLALTTHEGSRWMEVVETLQIHRPAPETAIHTLEAKWRFHYGKEALEVFTPNLVPEETDVIGTHVLRSPAITAQSRSLGVALATSPEFLARSQPLPPVMNLLRAADGELTLSVALRAHEVRGHVFFRATNRTAQAPIFYLHYFLYAAPQPAEGGALAEAAAYVWEHFGRGQANAARPLPIGYADIAELVYVPMIKSKWRESTLGGKRIGAIALDRCYAGDVWFTAWFNALQSAYGFYGWGRHTRRQDWIDRALAVRELALAAPSRNGLFPTVFVFGKTPERDRWVGSHHQGGGPGILHLMDMSWTVHLLLRLSSDFAPSPAALQKAREYCAALLNLQRPDGSFPAYVDETTHETIERVSHAAILQDILANPGTDINYLRWGLKTWPEERYTHSAEDSASLLALCETALALPAGDPQRKQFIEAAGKSADFLREWAFKEHRWLDMELSFSCSPKPLDFYDKRSGQWPQNTLCMNYAALGLLRLYELTHAPAHLALARRALDRLQMYQQVWSPPFLNIDAVGGYGVQNCDGEWSDARQGAFVFTHAEFARVTGDPSQLERAKAACRGSFSTMFVPALGPLYPTGWQRQPRGIASENHAHCGYEENCVVSGFDWGAGSALSAAAYLHVRELL